MRQPDAIIIGGGIQGATIALAASERGLRTVIVERHELAAGASGNSYGIIHGGLRYLQTLDIARWKRSKNAQAWYLEHFPEFVRPLRCVMPLYRWRWRSALFFKAAVLFENLLAKVFKLEVALPKTTFIPAAATKTQYAKLPESGLSGAACWYDAEVINMPAVIAAILQKSGLDSSAVMTNTEATELLARDGQVTGVRVKNKTSGKISDIESNIVINCTGSWAGHWQPTTSSAVTTPTAAALAFNLLLDIPAVGDGALALSVTPGKGRCYFMRPYPGGMLAGTFYIPAPGMTEPQVSDSAIQQFLSELTLAFPGLEIMNAKVLKVMAGLLPDTDGSGTSLSSKDYILSHDLEGFYTVLGGKLTTAPLLSRDAVKRIWPKKQSTFHVIPPALDKQRV